MLARDAKAAPWRAQPPPALGDPPVPCIWPPCWGCWDWDLHSVLALETPWD